MTFLVSKEHRAIIVPGDSDLPVRIPTARPLDIDGKRLWAVPFNVREAIQLRHIGVPVPSPIGTYYDWPRDISKIPAPFANQIETSAFCTLNHRAYVLNEIGTGKSVAALWAADYLMSVGMIRKALILSPLSTLDRVWSDEVFNHFGHRSIAVLHGTAEKRKRLFANNAFDFYVINHDAVDIIAEMIYRQVKGAKKLVDARFLRDDIDLVIIDELAVYRNSQTNRWRILNKLIKPPMWVWGLTGTPTPNSPADAYGQVKLVTPDRAPEYFSAFRQQVMQQMTEYIWVPRRESAKIVHQVMQPAVRFERDQCFDLPPCMYVTRECELTAEQKRHYKEISKELFTEIQGGKVTAVNEGVKAGKLLQIACLPYNTPVLTDWGWRPIQEVWSFMRVWDGEAWVTHKGCAYRGQKHVVEAAGILATADHHVLSTRGWVTAREMRYGYASGRLAWEKVRLPDGYRTSRHDFWKVAKSCVALPLRLWECRTTAKSKLTLGASSQRKALRMSPWRVAEDTRDDENTDIPYVVGDDPTLYEPGQQGLEELRRSRDIGVSRMAALVRDFLARYAPRIRTRKNTGAEGQQRPVFKNKLPLGNSSTAGQQPADKPDHTHARREDDRLPRSAALRGKKSNAVRAAKSWLACAKSIVSSGEVIATYDLLDCGPLRRFTIMGMDGEARIVHNCGVVYDKEGHERAVDASPRVQLLREIIEQATNKVIVFVPFRAPLEMLYRELGKDFKCAMVHGGVSKSQRATIFLEFQKNPELRVLLADAGTMSHGLTLTEANTIVWYGPEWSNDIYEQANGRITRSGQKNNQYIIHIAGTEIERRIYARLRERGRTQGVLLAMAKEGTLG